VRGTGYFYQPTVLVDVPPDASALTEEVFGPVAPIVVVRDADEAVAQANASRYGSAGTSGRATSRAQGGSRVSWLRAPSSSTE
jgi:acyl-CoA reductase-like NAD-dependent aldehyde dehydrogenase